MRQPRLESRRPINASSATAYVATSVSAVSLLAGEGRQVARPGRTWPVLHELERQGQSWPQAVWDAADAMATGATDPSAFDTGLACG
jgi:hypothetical protein